MISLLFCGDEHALAGLGGRGVILITAAAEERGHVVELVFVERGGSSSAKKALADITQKWEGMCLHLEFQKI